MVVKFIKTLAVFVTLLVDGGGERCGVYGGGFSGDPGTPRVALLSGGGSPPRMRGARTYLGARMYTACVARVQKTARVVYPRFTGHPRTTGDGKTQGIEDFEIDYKIEPSR